MDEREKIEQAIAALEDQRAALGDPVVEAALAPLRARLDELQARPAGEQRKLVSILFADLVGFTALSETRDPEEIREVLRAYFDRWSAQIKDHGGVVEKFIGDAVMAVFGLAQAQEDDPERALRAALAMQRSLKELNKSLERTHDLQLTMRVGVHTGQVLVSTLAERPGQDFVVVGDSVNLASRLQSSAPPGGLIISEATYRLVRGIFEVQPQEPLKVKGIREPLQTYLVTGEKPRAFRTEQRGLEGIATRMVGREAEFRRLQDAFYEAVEYRERQMVLLIGNAGVGKSRLIYEFDQWLETVPEQAIYLKGRASSAMTKTPHALLRDMFSWRFEIHDSDPPELLRDRLEQGVRAVLGERSDWQRRSHYLGRLIGFEFESPHLPAEKGDARSLHDQAVLYLRDYFKSLTRQAPLVILLEDLHWADESSLNLLSQLESALDKHPVLLVCSARPTLFERRPHWGEGQPYLTRLDLRGLSRRDSRRLVAEILQKVEAIPEQLEELLIANAEGNPFYLEELVKMLIEVGVIAKGEDRWQVDVSRLSSASIPTTLVGVLQSRLDRLAVEERLCLQRAAVVGRVFWDNAVAYLAKQPYEQTERREDEEILESLRRREMVYRREASAFADTDEFFFRHAMLRDVTYESVLKAHRRTYHARTARWLEAVTEGTGRGGEYAALIGEHHDRAGEQDLAARWYRRAGEQAAARYANAEAVRFFSRALELTPEDELIERYDLLSSREAVNDLLGERQAQEQDLQVLEELIERLGDENRRTEVTLRRASLAFITGELREARRAAGAAVRLSEANFQVNEKAARMWIDGYIILGRAASFLGEIETAWEELSRALELAREIGYRQGEVNALERLGILCSYQGDYLKAIDYLQEALLLAREIEDQLLERSVLNNLGIGAKLRGDYPAALEYYQQSQTIAHKTGDRLGESTALNNLGVVSQSQGYYEQALEYSQRSLVNARQIGDRTGEGIALTNLGEALTAIGDYQGAERFAAQALEIMQETGYRMGEGIILENLGKIAQLQGNYPRTLELARQSLAIAEEIDDSVGQGYALLRQGEALAGLGEAEAAAESYRRALLLWDEEEEKSGRFQAMAGLARLLLDGDAPEGLQSAKEQIGPILADLDSDAITDGETPLNVLVTCWQVLQANQDPRASEVLARARALLETRAAHISDPQHRKSYLERVPAHREIQEQS